MFFIQTERKYISREIGERIRIYRVLRGMSQEELAYASDINPSYIGRLERGEKCPTIDTLYKVSLGLNLPLVELLNISAAPESTMTEAIHRIKTAMKDLSNIEMVEVAEIVERLVTFKGN